MIKKGHTRFLTTVLTAFLLVGVMAAVAVAGVTYDFAASKNSVEVMVGKTQKVKLILSATFSSAGNVTQQVIGVGTADDDGNYTADIDTDVAKITGVPTEAQGPLNTEGEDPWEDSTEVELTVEGVAEGETSEKFVWKSKTVEIQIKVIPFVETTKPVFSTTNPKELTWGKTWANFTPTKTKGSDVVKWAVSDDATAAVLTAAGLALNEETGEIAPVTEGDGVTFVGGNWLPSATQLNNLYDAATGKGKWNGAEFSCTIGIKGIADEEDDTLTGLWKGTLTFKGAALKIQGVDAGTLNTTISDTYGSASSVKATFEVYGPGEVSWDVSGLPEGFTPNLVAKGGAANTYTVTFTGTPDKAYKNEPITFNVGVVSADNKNNTASKTFKYSATANALTIAVEKGGSAQTVGDGTPWWSYLPNGDQKVDADADDLDIVFTATPGPVTWDTTGIAYLTSVGLTAAQSGDQLVISGKYTTPRPTNEDSKNTYKMNVKNDLYANEGAKDAAGEAEAGLKLMVWEAPKFTNSYIFNAKKDTFKANTKLNQAIPFENMPTAVAKSFDISINDTPIIVAGAAAEGYEDGYAITGGESYGTAYTSKSKLSFDLTQLKNNKIVLVGSTDCVPAGGENVTITITAKNYANTEGVEQTYTLGVTGTAPKVANTALTLKKTDPATSKDVALSAGDKAITVTAVIAAKDAKKVFGTDSDIDLMTAEGTEATGLSVTSVDEAGKVNVAYKPQAKLGDVAYKALPITITASNPDISTKSATGKYSVTLAGTKPTWSADVTNGLELTGTGIVTNLKEAEATGEKVLPAAVTISVPGNTTLTKPIVLALNGSGPFTYTVKPESKNGLEAAFAQSETDGSITLSISGTPSAAKKDVATKFTITAKNNSTGDQAKLNLTVNAIPTPEAAETELSTGEKVLFGKKVNLKPKLTVSGKNVTWFVSKIDGSPIDEVDGTFENTKDSQKTAVAALKTLGLALDTKKGSLTGTPKFATGAADDKAVTITAGISGDISANSEFVKFTVKVLGEKVKLLTKTVTVDAAEPDWTASKNVIKTTLSQNKRTTTQGKMEVGETGISGNFSDIEELANVTFVEDADNNGQYTLTGTPSGVTKKAAVTVKMVNYDTESTGKLSVVVDGSKPEIDGTSEVTVEAGSSEELTLTISNPNLVSSKLKWKISSKPSMSGVSAKVKGGSDKDATVTVKAKKKISGTTSFKVEVTDSGTSSKKTSEAYTINVTVNDPEAEATSALEATNTTAKDEAEAEAKVLGEGDIIADFDHDRTLPAGQRAQLEAQGYVIAAVLPEIEVTADGQYDFEVDLDEKVATGAELVWFAFASKPTTDDEIADFEDVDGNETKVVPENHVVVVWPWLNAGTKYAPVIAVKADVAEADAMTEEGVKEAAEEAKEEE